MPKLVAVVTIMTALVLGLMVPGQASADVEKTASVADFSDDARYQRFYHQDLVWSKNCFGTEGTDQECAKVQAPLDWKDPSKGSIDIGISRQLTNGVWQKKDRLLFANPGGPGYTGMGLTKQIISVLGLGQTHVGIDIDPRGVAASVPVVCAEFNVGNFPGRDRDSRDITADQAAATDRSWQKTTEECVKKYPDLLQYINSDQIARDFNLIRSILGFAKVDFWGISYGTWLGSYYAKAFPDSVDRVVLDSNMGWQDSLDNTWRQMAAASQQVFDQALAPYLARHSDRYGLGGTANEVVSNYELIRAEIKKRGKLKSYTPDQLDKMIFDNLYRVENFPQIGDQLSSLKKALDTPSDSATTVAPKPTTSAKSSSRATLRPQPSDQIPVSNPIGQEEITQQATAGFGPYLAISCNDTAGMRDQASWFSTIQPLLNRFPLTSQGKLDGARCTKWPWPMQLDQQIIDRPIKAFVVQNELDPATPIWQTVSTVRKSKGGSKLFLVDNGVGHGAFEAPCAAKAEGQYLSTGQFPSADGSCLGAPLPDETLVYRYGADLAPLKSALTINDYAERSFPMPKPVEIKFGSGRQFNNRRQHIPMQRLPQDSFITGDQPSTTTRR